MKAFNTKAQSLEALKYTGQECIFDDLIFSDDVILYYFTMGKSHIAFTKKKIIVFTPRNLMLQIIADAVEVIYIKDIQGLLYSNKEMQIYTAGKSLSFFVDTKYAPSLMEVIETLMFEQNQ